MVSRDPAFSTWGSFGLKAAARPPGPFIGPQVQELPPPCGHHGVSKLQPCGPSPAAGMGGSVDPWGEILGGWLL